VNGQRASAAFVLALALLLERTAGAQPAQQPAEALETNDQARLEVEVRLVAGAARDPAFAERIASWFDAQRFRVKVITVAWLDPQRVLTPQRGASVYVWVTMQERRARLYFARVDRAQNRASYLLRDLPLQQGLDEIGAEQIAQAVHFSTVALLEGQLESPRAELEQSLKAEESPPPPPPPPAVAPAPAPATERPTTPPRRATAVELSPGIGYGLTYRGETEGVGHGPRASLKLAWSGTWLVGARLAATLPLERTVGPIALELSGGSVALTGGIRQRLGHDLGLELFAGPVVELLHYSSTPSSSSGLSPGGAENEARPQLMAGLAGTFGSEPRLAILAEVIFALSDTHYDLVLDSGSAEIGRPSWVMPGLSFELQF